MLRDFIYEWKHACSKDNQYGTRKFFIAMTILMPLVFVIAVAGIITGIMLKSVITIMVATIALIADVGAFCYLAFQK